MTTRTADTIILIPAYQPGQALLEATRRLLTASYTVIVVDDGSGEEYNKIFSGLDPRVKLLVHDTNQGKGAALKTGFRYIKSHYENCIVVAADADGQHRFDDIQRVTRSYRTHAGSLLLGVREFTQHDVPFRSKFGNELTRKVFSLVTRQSIRDTQTGLRAFDQSLLDFMLRVPGNRFEYEINMLLSASREGVTITEQPIETIYENNNESSHFKPIKDSLAIYTQIVKFASSSLLSFVVDYLLFILLLQLTNSWTLAASVTFANVTARILSASFNFGLNRRYIFHHQGSVIKGALQYATLAILILAGNTLLLGTLVHNFAVNAYFAKIVTELIFFILSYFIQKHIIFARKETKNL